MGQRHTGHSRRRTIPPVCVLLLQTQPGPKQGASPCARARSKKRRAIFAKEDNYLVICSNPSEISMSATSIESPRAKEGTGERQRNAGIPLDLDWVNQVQVNRGAV